ncbi:putative Polycomb group protein ASXL2 [Xenia sp. Carnegie-2017]|uniref:putative Polycomb group protein ASXL2 n=1 Tax=Xenia sp. Carnegie-2017 TaxID=2897299 RepID=UPI001F03832D|nr:putative Polycomb group protein ASXL2 [Xenia sp. Carnegie-2017]
MEKLGMDKSKKKGITWGEAAKIVLENAKKPLNHKEILNAILDQKLKEVSLKFSQALACLNAMLHANSRTPASLFSKVTGKTNGRGTCYQLNKKHQDSVESSESETDSPDSSSNEGDIKVEEKEESPSQVSSESSSQNSNISPSGSLPPISSNVVSSDYFFKHFNSEFS